MWYKVSGVNVYFWVLHILQDFPFFMAEWADFYYRGRLKFTLQLSKYIKICILMCLIIDIFWFCTFFLLYLRAKEEKKIPKKEEMTPLFSTSSLRSAVFLVRLKPNLFILAIVLRTRSQIAEHCLSEASLRG